MAEDAHIHVYTYWWIYLFIYMYTQFNNVYQYLVYNKIDNSSNTSLNLQKNRQASPFLWVVYNKIYHSSLPRNF